MDNVVLAYSELRSLVIKAARGGGLDWGIAEEAGWAAEWLARRGFPAADWATAWLADVVDGRVGAVETGVALADHLASCAASFALEAMPDGVVATGYFLPFLHRVAGVCGPVEVTGRDGRVVAVAADGTVTFGPSWALTTLGWSLRGGSVPDRSELLASAPLFTGRPSVSVSVIECLEGLALRTTVPPSEFSRNDAGSATPDRD